MKEGKTRGNVKRQSALYIQPMLPPPKPGPKETQMNRDILNTAMDLCVKEIANKRENAGFNGSWDDGGAGDLQMQLDAFKAGLYGEMPEFLKEHYAEAKKNRDPEYAEYQRLRAKFEDTQ